MMRTTRTGATVPWPPASSGLTILERWAFPVAALLFFLAPGNSDSWFSGLPIGLWPMALASVLTFAWCMARVGSRRPDLTRAAAALVVLVIVKVAAGTMAPASGWLGRYYANGRFAGEPRRSTEFVRLDGATRIDRAIDFHDDYLPLYFLNEADFNRGIRREVTEPVSVWWTGHLGTDRTRQMQLSLEARGTLSLSV